MRNMTFIKGDETIYICEIKEYKKPVLMVGLGYIVHKIASFNSEEEADYFIDMLERWLGTEKHKEVSNE